MEKKTKLIPPSFCDTKERKEWLALATRPGHLRPGMPWSDWADLNAYIREVRRCMYLQHWEIEVQSLPPNDPEAFAMVEPRYGQNYAKLWVCEDWAELKLSELRQYIAHEFTHLIWELTARYSVNDQEHLRNPNERKSFHNGFTRIFEHAIDHTSLIIAESLPKYPDPKRHR
jgi:hypothetical protein